MKLTVPSTTGTENDTEWFYHWDSGYKVTVLTKGGRWLDLPGEKTHIGSEQVLENRDTLVFGEAGGGHSNFVRWWRSGLDGGARDWILVDASSWDRSFFRRRSGVDRSGESGAQNQAGEAIEKLGLEQGVLNRAQALRGWSEKLERPFTLIISNLMALGKGPALEVATALRRLRDFHLCPNLRVVVSSPSESIFADQIDRSGYRSLCEEYRLPSLDGEDVVSLAGTQSSDPSYSPLSFEQEALERFLAHTGGQPLLVRHLLARLGGLAIKKGARATTAQIDEAARQMRYSPPGRARVWPEDLQRLLSEVPELIPAMESYVAGGSLGPARFPPPAEERALFIAGWVRLNEMGRWGITSKFHAHLARPVLQSLRTNE